MILIYAHIITPRLSYVIDLIFDTVLQTPYKLTNDKTTFDEYASFKIAYTEQPASDALFIRANSLLFEKDINSKLPVAEKNYEVFPRFFKSPIPDFLGYDIFAMVFYFASRYEEYLEASTDKHQRFKAENTIAFQHGCLQFPFLNAAIEDFSLKLKNKFPDIVFQKRAFNFVSTIDIDNAFAYAHKGLKRNLGGFTKDFLAMKFNDLVSRITSNINDEKDPYNTFELINNLSKQSNTALQYFVLIGDYSVYDKNPDHTNEGFKKLLKSLAGNYHIGLHPSYESFLNPEKIGVEKKRLESIIGKKVTSARCHFLRINLPDTYRTFIDLGITDDYTMIFATQTGFRTGLCVPYKWFDLKKNEITNLTIHTSAVMEGILRDYNQYTSEDAKNILLKLIIEVKKYGGEFISIFHNDSFAAKQKEWVELYKIMLQKSVS